MQYEQIMSVLRNRQKGSMLRLTYRSEPPVSAVAKKAGYEVEKITETTVRWGVAYSNIRKVINRREMDKELGLERKEPTLWWTWVEPNIIKQHNKTGAKYLSVASVPKGHNTLSRYIVNGQEVSEKRLREMGLLIPSYWQKEDVEKYDIKLDNILEIKA